MVKTIAIIDDDIYISDMLTEVLEREGYRTVRAYSGTEALYLLDRYKPDLILLDLMLPGLSGDEVLGQINSAGIPVIVLSAKMDPADKIGILRGGAADYMTKPFDTGELSARIAVQLRNAERSVRLMKEENSTAPLSVGDMMIDPLSLGVTVGSHSIKLTRTEYAILKLLMENPHRVIAKSVMLEQIATDTPDCTERSLKQHISNLRRKLRETGSGIDRIETIWGIGFKLTDADTPQ